MKSTLRRKVVTAAALAAVVSGLAVGAASPALAYSGVEYNPDADNSAFPYHLDPANEAYGGAYTLRMTPNSRTGVDGGSSALEWGPGEIRIDQPCPTGYRASSRQFIVRSAGGEFEALSPLLPGDSVTKYGFHDGETITYGSPSRDLPRFELTNATTLPTGVNALVFTCDPPAPDTGGTGGIPDGFTIANSKYFVAWIKVDRAAVHWEQTTDPRAATKTATTTTVASSNVSQTGLTLTATVAPNAASGTVQFTQGGTPIGSPVTVSGGTATTTLSGLTAGTAYTFGAQYSGDSTYAASTGSVDVTTAAVPAQDTATSPVSVTVPTATTAQPTGLKMTAKPQAITLTGAGTRTAGQVWAATGELGNVIVDDDRQSASTPWTLNGRISALASGSNSIAASNVGWKPALVGTGAGTAGTEVTAGANGGLSSDKPLATGTGSATAHVTTTVGATITLNTPADAAAGNYTGTLTLTLI